MGGTAEPFNLQGFFSDMRSDYAAARSSRFRRRRTGVSSVGSGADYHYRSEGDYLRILEQARDMYRNDAVVGQAVDRCVLNTIQNGFNVDPQTGDGKLDEDLWARWDEWANDPDLCDAGGEMCFADMEEAVFRAQIVDGDIFALPLESGQLQLVESHRCRTPTKLPKSGRMAAIHGVVIDQNRRRVEYWFTKDDIHPSLPIRGIDSVTVYQARDPNGRRQVFHVYKPSRASQTRGVSAFAPVFDVLGMVEDIQFAKLVQQQVVSCFAIIREREMDWRGPAGGQTGEQTSQTLGDGSTRVIQGVSPGMDISGTPGEKISGFSPSVPNAEYFPHIRLVLTMIGINLGLPLVMFLMDASETNFSGYRGAMDQARMGFRSNQRRLRDKFHRRVYQWKLDQWSATDPALARARDRIDDKAFFTHRWNVPRWPYIQPLQDAQADAMRVEKLLISPRRKHAELGQEYDEVMAETVADNALAIRSAIGEQQKIKSETGVVVDWHELLHVGSTGEAAPATAPGTTAPGSPGNDTETNDDEPDGDNGRDMIGRRR